MTIGMNDLGGFWKIESSDGTHVCLRKCSTPKCSFLDGWWNVLRITPCHDQLRLSDIARITTTTGPPSNQALSLSFRAFSCWSSMLCCLCLWAKHFDIIQVQVFKSCLNKWRVTFYNTWRILSRSNHGNSKKMFVILISQNPLEFSFTLFKRSIFHCYVSLPDCINSNIAYKSPISEN